MKSTSALNAFGRTIVSELSSRKYCGLSADSSAGRRIALLPPVNPRFTSSAVSVHQDDQPLSSIARWMTSAESSPDPFSQIATWVPGTLAISFATECRQSIARWVTR